MSVSISERQSSDMACMPFASSFLSSSSSTGPSTALMYPLSTASSGVMSMNGHRTNASISEKGNVGAFSTSSLQPSALLRQPRCTGNVESDNEQQGNNRSRIHGSSETHVHGGFNARNVIFRASAGMGGGGVALFGGSGGARASPLWPLKTKPRGPREVIAPKDKRKRIMILMSDTGGGHRASAEALKSGFKELFGDKYRIDIVDLWTDHTPWPFNQLPKSYSFMVHHPWIWRLNFTMTQPQFVHLPLANFGALLTGPKISDAFDKYQPNLIISVHPLMQHVPVRVLRQRIAAGIQDPSTSFTTVVTDLTTCHNTWFYKGVDRCYVATEATRQQALNLGLHSKQIRLFGLPIRPAFHKRFARKTVLRKRLGMDLKTPAVLLVGGGEGMGPVERTVEALASVIGKDCQVVVICGRNARLVEKLSLKKYPEGMQVHVKGFITNMPDFMNACDAIITKAGPGTISEALICGLPLVLNAFVPCQEEGNIPFVTENKVGIFETDALKAAQAIKRWLQGGQQTLKKMSLKAKAIARPEALFDIVKDLETLIGRSHFATEGIEGHWRSLVHGTSRTAKENAIVAV